MADVIVIEPRAKSQGEKMLKQAYGFMKELLECARGIDEEPAKSIMKQDLEALKSCWESSMVHYRQKDYGLMSLHLAVMAGNLDIVKFLTERGADLSCTAYTSSKSTKFYYDLSCLHLAVLFCRKDIVDYLLDHSAFTEHYIQFHYKMKKMYSKLNGMTPYHYAIFSHDIELLKLFAKYKASVGATTQKGYTPLHLAAMLNYDDTLQYIFNDSKLFENALSKDGASPLFVAAANGAYKTLPTLISKGYDVNIRNKEGVSVLHAAAVSGSKATVDALCVAGAVVNATCDNYKVKLRNRKEEDFLDEVNPLHAALAAKEVNSVKALLKHGAKSNVCCTSKHAGEDVRPLHLAVLQHSRASCELLVKHGAQINAKNAEGFTPLMGSIIEGDVSVFKFLLHQKNIDVNINHTGTKFSPLLAVILLLKDDKSTRSKDLKMIRLILENPSIDLEQEYVFMHRHEVTVLHLAVHKGDKDLVELLLEKGANVHHTMFFHDINTSGVTLMHTVATQGYDHLVDILHKAGAPLDLKTSKGVTPLFMALLMDFDTLVQFFLDHGADPNGGDSCDVTTLMIAAEKENFPLMKKLIKKGCDINRRNIISGRTALHLALYAKSLVAAHLLIDHGCDITMSTGADQTTLSLAIAFADVRFVERLLKKGADPNQKFSYLPDGQITPGDAQLMPLHLASRLGKVDMMRTLLKYGAKLNAELVTGVTPIFEAFSDDDDNAARFLIQKGAIVNQKLQIVPSGYRWQQEVFATAFARETSDVVLDLLVDFGAQIFCPYFAGATSSNFLDRYKAERTESVKKLFFHGLLSNQSIVKLLQPQHYNTLKIVLQHGVDLSKYLEEIYYAVGESSKTDIPLLLLQCGVDFCRIIKIPKSKPKVRGSVVFIAAARLGHLDMVKMLLKFGVDPDYQDENGLTALHWAAHRRKEDCVKLLISYGASITLRGSLNGYEDATPLHAGVISNVIDVMDPIIVAGADVNATCRRGDISGITPLMMAAYSQCLDSVWMFTSGYGCDLNKQNSNGETALHIMIQSPIFLKKHFIKDLMREGPDVNVTTNDGLTSLMTAVKMRNEDIVHLLIGCTQDINAAAKPLPAENGDPRTVGRTALHFAASKGNSKIVKMLVEVGANLNSTETHDDTEGYTPIHCAVLKDHIEIIPILVKAGGNINARTSEGLTALHIAAKEGLMDMTKKLMDLEINPKLRTNNGEIASNMALFPTIGRLLLGYEAAWDLKHRRPTLRKRFSLQQRLSMQKIEAFTTQSFSARIEQDDV